MQTNLNTLSQINLREKQQFIIKQQRYPKNKNEKQLHANIKETEKLNSPKTLPA